MVASNLRLFMWAGKESNTNTTHFAAFHLERYIVCSHIQNMSVNVSGLVSCETQAVIKFLIAEKMAGTEIRVWVQRMV